MKNKSDRLLELDALRGLAALGVVLFHYTFYNPNKIGYVVPFSFAYGAECVHLFFVISGFVIFMTLDKIANAQSFIISRFSRLYPVYWISILLNVILIPLIGNQFTGHELSIKRLLYNITMFQGHLNIPNIDGVYWTLTVELSFYVFLLSIFLLKVTDHIVSIGIGYVLLQILYTKLKYFFHVFVLPDHVETFTMIRYFHFFLAGMVFYKIWKGEKSFANHFVIVLCFLAERIISGRWGPSFAITGLIFLMFYFLINHKLKFLNHPVLIFLGAISYSLYLIHANMGFLMIDRLNKIPAINSWIIILVPIAVSVSLAFLIHKTIEVPAMKYIRGKKYRQSTAT